MQHSAKNRARSAWRIRHSRSLDRRRSVPKRSGTLRSTRPTSDGRRSLHRNSTGRARCVRCAEETDVKEEDEWRQGPGAKTLFPIIAKR